MGRGGEGRGKTMAIKIVEKDSDKAKCLNSHLLPIKGVLAGKLAVELLHIDDGSGYHFLISYSRS